MSLGNLHEFLQEMQLSQQQELIGKQILREIRARVGFLNDVGLSYLSLSARASSSACVKLPLSLLDCHPITCMAPPFKLSKVVRGRKGQHEKVLDRARRSGYVRVRIDGNLYDLSEHLYGSAI